MGKQKMIKINTLGKIIALSLVAVNIHAEECRTELNGNDRYTELSGILTCLSTKIKSMDAEITALKNSKVSNPIVSTDSKCGSVKSDGIIASLTPVMTGSKINANFTIENTTSEPLYLVWDFANRPTLSDDTYALSAQTNNHTTTGMPYSQIGSRDLAKVENYTKLAASQKLAIGLSFDISSKPYKTGGQTHVSVAMNFLRLNTANGKVERISASPCALMKIND